MASQGRGSNGILMQLNWVEHPNPDQEESSMGTS